MLAYCVNEGCNRPLHSFSEGRLFQFEVVSISVAASDDKSAPFEDQQVGKMIFATFIILMFAMVLLDISPILILLLHGSNTLYNHKILSSIETKKKEEDLNNTSILFSKEREVNKAMDEKRIKTEEELLKFEAETRTQRILDEKKDLLDKTILFNEYQRNGFVMVNKQLEPIDDTPVSDWGNIACSIYETYVSTHKNGTKQFLEDIYAKPHTQSFFFD